MRLLRAAWPAFASSCLIAFCASACGSSKGSNVTGNGTTAGNGTGATGATDGGGLNLSNGGGTGGGGTGGGGTGGGLNLGNGGTVTGSGGQGVVNQCAGTLIQAQRIPLDMYVMLDVSGSMLDPTVGNAKLTKWQAVSSALNDFVSDPASDGIGIGIQTFPLTDVRAPTSCTTNAQCANFGGCFLKACWNAAVGLPPCNSDLDCGLVRGACDGVGVCSGNADFVCPTANVGQGCGADPDTGVDLGTCQARASSTCIVTDDCREASYAMPAVAIAALPGAKPGIVKVLQAAMPGGLTPTGPALTGAIDQAGQWATAHTDHQVVAVLATDGLPTLKAQGQYCGAITTTSATADDNAVAAVAATGAASTPKVSTFVIGVFAPTDVAQGAPAVLNAIAKAGGSSSAFIVNTMGNVEMQFRDALNAIRATGLSCELAVPMPEAGKTLDFGEVNVAFDSGKGPVDLENVPGVADCAAHPQAWYYNVDPTQGTPTRIEACPGVCADFEKTDMGSVQIELGCKTKVVVK